MIPKVSVAEVAATFTVTLTDVQGSAEEAEARGGLLLLLLLLLLFPHNLLPLAHLPLSLEPEEAGEDASSPGYATHGQPCRHRV